MNKKQSLWKVLSCDLTPDEIGTYSQELAIITTEQSEIEAENKEVMSTFTARLNKCIADGRVLARKITTRKEDRQVECDLEFDYVKAMVYTIRTDTGVTIGQRKLSDDERQEWLDFEGEQDKKQEAEEKAEELDHRNMDAEDRANNGIVSDDSITVCGNTDCEEYEPDEANHCGFCENVWECEKVTAEQIAENDCNSTVEDEAEHARRDSICKEWTACEYKDICFTPQNEEDAICFKDEPHRVPVSEDFQRNVNRLTHTSADDCKISLLYVTDLKVLHAALEEVTVNGEKTKAKYISSRINQLQKEQETKPSLAELCSLCHTSNGGCQFCCKKCQGPCNSKQDCRWPA